MEKVRIHKYLADTLKEHFRNVADAPLVGANSKDNATCKVGKGTKMEDGFRLGNFYGSYYADETHSCIGIEIGFIDVPNCDDSVTAHTFSIAIKISHFIFAIGYILKEF